jgi:hypothetical protein
VTERTVIAETSNQCFNPGKIVSNTGRSNMHARGKIPGVTQAASLVPACTLLAVMLGTPPASAAIEQCRFIQAKAEREACYDRQAIALAAKRKPEPSNDTSTLESLQQMRREDDTVYRSLRSICRGC